MSAVKDFANRGVRLLAMYWAFLHAVGSWGTCPCSVLACCLGRHGAGLVCVVHDTGGRSCGVPLVGVQSDDHRVDLPFGYDVLTFALSLRLCSRAGAPLISDP